MFYTAHSKHEGCNYSSILTRGICKAYAPCYSGVSHSFPPCCCMVWSPMWFSGFCFTTLLSFVGEQLHVHINVRWFHWQCKTDEMTTPCLNLLKLLHSCGLLNQHFAVWIHKNAKSCYTYVILLCYVHPLTVSHSAANELPLTEASFFFFLIKEVFFLKTFRHTWYKQRVPWQRCEVGDHMHVSTCWCHWARRPRQLSMYEGGKPVGSWVNAKQRWLCCVNTSYNLTEAHCWYSKYEDCHWELGLSDTSLC